MNERVSCPWCNRAARTQHARWCPCSAESRHLIRAAYSQSDADGQRVADEIRRVAKQWADVDVDETVPF